MEFFFLRLFFWGFFCVNLVTLDHFTRKSPLKMFYLIVNIPPCQLTLFRRLVLIINSFSDEPVSVVACGFLFTLDNINDISIEFSLGNPRRFYRFVFSDCILQLLIYRYSRLQVVKNKVPLNKIILQFLFDSLFQCPETKENANEFLVHIQSLRSNSVCLLEKGLNHWMTDGYR